MTSLGSDFSLIDLVNDHSTTSEPSMDESWSDLGTHPPSSPIIPVMVSPTPLFDDSYEGWCCQAFGSWYSQAVITHQPDWNEADSQNPQFLLPDSLESSPKLPRERYLASQSIHHLFGHTARRRCQCSSCSDYLSSSNLVEGGCKHVNRYSEWTSTRRAERHQVRVYEMSDFDMDFPVLAHRQNLNKHKGWERIPEALASLCTKQAANPNVRMTGHPFPHRSYTQHVYSVALAGHVKTQVAMDKQTLLHADKPQVVHKNYKPGVYYTMTRHYAGMPNNPLAYAPHDASALSQLQPHQCVRELKPIRLTESALAKQASLKRFFDFSVSTHIQGKAWKVAPRTWFDARALTEDDTVIRNQLVGLSHSLYSQVKTLPGACVWALASSLPTVDPEKPITAHLQIDFGIDTPVAALAFRGRPPPVRTFPPGNRRTFDPPFFPVLALDEQEFCKRVHISARSDRGDWIDLGTYATANVDAISETFVEMPAGLLCRWMRIRPLRKAHDGYEGPGPAMRVGVWVDEAWPGRRVDQSRAEDLQPDEGCVSYSVYVPTQPISRKFVTGPEASRFSRGGYKDSWGMRTRSRAKKTRALMSAIKEQLLTM